MEYSKKVRKLLVFYLYEQVPAQHCDVSVVGMMPPVQV